MPQPAPEVATNASASAGRPVRRRRWALIAATGLLAIAVVLAWRLWPRSQSYYTDAEHIREPVESASLREVLWQPPVRLAEPINTSTDDYEPRLSADGMTLFFVRGKAGENADIYISQRVPVYAPNAAGETPPELECWTAPQPLAEINSPADDLGPELSPDGDALYFYSDRAGGSGGYDLWVAYRSEHGWLGPVNLGPQVNSPFNDYGPAISPDGTTLYFASNRPQPQDPGKEPRDAWVATIREDLYRRDYDLFAAAITERGVGEPRPLAELNTEWNEGAPALSPVGDFFYFASDRPGGSGGFDLYRSRLLRGEFQPPENLGAGVNTEANELDPAPGLGGFALHFSSDRRRGAPPAPDTRPDYEIFRTSSREVFTETQTLQASIDWGWLWSQIGPSLLLALLTLLLLLLLLRYLGGLRSRELSLLMRCVLASLFLHLLLLFLFSFWNVTAAVAGAFQRRGGMKVALTSSATTGAIESQVLSELTSVRFEAADVRLVQAAPPQSAAMQELALLDPNRRLIESSASTLVQPAINDAPLPAPLPALELAPSAASPERPVIDSPLKLAVPEAAAAVQAREAAVSVEPIQTSGPRANLTEVRGELAGSPALTQVMLAPGAIASESASALPLVEAPALSDAAVTLTPAPMKLPSQPVANATWEPRLPAPEHREPPPEAAEAAPAPAAVAATAQPAPLSNRPPSGSAANPEFTQIDPAASSRVLDSETSLASAARHSISGGTIPPQPEKPRIDMSAVPAAALGDLALPADETAQAKASVASEERSAFLPEAEAASAAPPMMNLSAPAAVTDSVALAPAESVQPDAAERSLAASARTPVDAPLALQAVAPVTDASASQPEELALSLRIPTEILPPENPYAQRGVTEKDDLVKRLGGSEATERAVKAALAWLAAHQSPDGHWDGAAFDRRCGQCGGATDLEVHVGLTGLSLLCFLGANHTHQTDGPYRRNVELAIEWLLNLQGTDGDLRGEETMYSHGIAAIALSEAYGMTKDPRLARPVLRAARFIEEARNTSAGGWRYDPGQAGDTSVLGWQVMALKSAAMAGVPVAPETFTAASAWLVKVSNPARPGLYAYQPQRRPSAAMTAEGMFVQQLLGVPRDDERMAGSATYLAGRLPNWGAALDTYYWYYATLALFQHQGEVWERWNQALTRELLDHQEGDGAAAGSWAPRGKWADKGGRVYQTALCTLMLEVYYRYLPLYSMAPAEVVAAP